MQANQLWWSFIRQRFYVAQEILMRIDVARQNVFLTEAIVVGVSLHHLTIVIVLKECDDEPPVLVVGNPASVVTLCS